MLKMFAVAKGLVLSHNHRVALRLPARPRSRPGELVRLVCCQATLLLTQQLVSRGAMAHGTAFLLVMAFAIGSLKFVVKW